MPVQNAETADAEIKVLSADNLELLQIPDLSPGVGQNIYIYRNADWFVSPGAFNFIFSKLSSNTKWHVS